MGPDLLELAAIPTGPGRDGKGDADLRFSVLHGLRAITNAGRGGVGRPLCRVAAAFRALQGDAPLPPAIVTLPKGEGADLLVLRRVPLCGLSRSGGGFFSGRVAFLRRVDGLKVLFEERLLITSTVHPFPTVLHACASDTDLQ